MINAPLQPGDNTVDGNGTPNCASILICLIGGGGRSPSTPACSPPDSLLGMGATGAAGRFNISVPPLQINQCLYAFDTCADRTSPVVCVRQAAPAPALSPQMLAIACAVLSLVALVALRRRVPADDAGPRS